MADDSPQWANAVGKHEVLPNEGSVLAAAMSFEEKGQLAEAAKKYKMILDKNKFSVLGLLGYKTIYLTNPNALLPLEPSESGAFLLDQIALCIEKSNDEEKSKAKAQLEEWAKSSAIGQGRLARFIDCIERDPKASSALLLKVNPGNPDVWFQLGAAYSFGDGGDPKLLPGWGLVHESVQRGARCLPKQPRYSLREWRRDGPGPRRGLQVV